MEPIAYEWAFRRGSFLPILISLWFFIRLWRANELFGKRAIVFGSWWAVATMTQLFAPSPGLWITGLLAQTALAIVLVLKQKMSDIV